MSQPIRILLTGSSGFIGSHLKVFLEQKGYLVVCLKRGSPPSLSSSNIIFWDPILRKWNLSDFENFQAVIHLAGEGIANSKWTDQRKKELVSSRCQATETLTQILCQLSFPPQLLISASAVGFYGDRKNTPLTEDSTQGQGFLADLCGKWEGSAKKVEEKGIRLIHSRFGLVIGKGGGLLQKMLPLLKWGLGGKLGSGEQFISWISLSDLLEGMVFCLKNKELRGPVNFVSPCPIEQKRFVKLLAKKLKRPAFCHIPAWILRLSLGELADELLLSSQAAKPKKLISSGFFFSYPDLDSALNQALANDPSSTEAKDV